MHERALGARSRRCFAGAADAESQSAAKPPAQPPVLPSPLLLGRRGREEEAVAGLARRLPARGRGGRVLGCACPGRCPVRCPRRCPPPPPLGTFQPRIFPVQVGRSPATSNEAVRPRPALLGRPVCTSSTPCARPQVPRVFEEVTPLPTTSPSVGRMSQPTTGLRAKHTHTLRFMLRRDSWAGVSSCLREDSPLGVAPHRSLRTPGVWTAPTPTGHCRRDSFRELLSGPGHLVYHFSHPTEGTARGT